MSLLYLVEGVSHHFFRLFVACFEVFGSDPLGVSCFPFLVAVDRRLQLLLREFWDVFTSGFTALVFVCFFRITFFFDGWVLHFLENRRDFEQRFHLLVFWHLHTGLQSNDPSENFAKVFAIPFLDASISFFSCLIYDMRILFFCSTLCSQFS